MTEKGRLRRSQGSDNPFSRAAPDGDTLSAIEQSLVADILELSVAERVRGVEAVWENIAASPQMLPIMEWQREEVDCRLAEIEADPHSGPPSRDPSN